MPLIMTIEPTTISTPTIPSVEVKAKPSRRTFSREYKQRILIEADVAKANRQLGALLRREGLYSAHLVAWRRDFEAAGASALAPKKRGPKPRFSQEELAMQKILVENERLKKQLEMAEGLLELQKKVQAIFDSCRERRGAE